MAIGEIEKNEEEYGRYGAGLFERQALEATRVRYITPENASFEDRDGCLFMRGKGGGESAKEQKRVMLHTPFFFSPGSPGLDFRVFQGRQYFHGNPFINRVNNNYNGMTIWKVTDADGNRPEFSLKDTYGSIFRVTDERFVITDADGNRFEIEDINKLDAKSRKKIELYI